MKKIVQIVALVILLVSCENDIKTNLPAFLGEKIILHGVLQIQKSLQIQAER